MDRVRWLDARERRAWRSMQFIQMRLEGELARQLAADSNAVEPGLSGAGRAHRPARRPATDTDRWILIDQTCQTMFVGNGDQLAFVFATSTGDADHPTRDQTRSAVFKYNPAAANGGWHNSTEYPAPEDNPRNGNMYKPLYFDAGQAIHGANSVPNFPASKGCVRLHVHEQDQLITWLGLDDHDDVVWGADAINLTVDVQGRWNDPT